MRQIILDFPKQFSLGADIVGDAGKQYAGERFENIIIAGMGGSALAGDVLKIVAPHIKLRLPISIHRDYGLPTDGSLRPHTLFVAISHSGNTEETLSAYRQALTQKITTMTISSGGTLKALAEKNTTPHVTIPSGIQPRLALGHQTTALLGMLAGAGLIASQHSEMEKIAQTLDSASLEDTGKELAEKIQDTTPLIYASSKYGALAYILKIQMNENAKLHAFTNTFPELNHNEMVGYEQETGNGEQGTTFSILLLRAQDDHLQIKRRMDLFEQLIKKRGYYVYSVDIKGENIYNRIFNTILVGSWLSYHLALNRNIDPTPVDIVEDFKKKLK